MKKALSLLLFLGLVVTAQGQSLDKVQYRITYKTLVVNDTTRRDSMGKYKYTDDDMRLDIGDKIGKFYSGRTAAFAKFIENSLKAGNAIDIRNLHAPHPHVTMVLYRNYPEGETTVLDEAITGKYRISEKTATPQWTLDGDTCTLLGYHCAKAEANFKGRHWTVWFTEDIPLDYGPWKLCGLPGLILKAEDAARQFVFDASGLEQIGGKEDITLKENYGKYEPVSQKNFDKVMRTATLADRVFEGGKMKVRTVDSEGHELSESESRKIYGTVSPYNPIEIVK